MTGNQKYNAREMGFQLQRDFQIENGVKLPSLLVIYKIANVLGVKVTEIIKD